MFSSGIIKKLSRGSGGVYAGAMCFVVKMKGGNYAVLTIIVVHVCRGSLCLIGMIYRAMYPGKLRSPLLSHPFYHRAADVVLFRCVTDKLTTKTLRYSSVKSWSTCKLRFYFITRMNQEEILEMVALNPHCLVPMAPISASLKTSQNRSHT